MAESSLSIGFVDLKREVGFHLGYGRGDSPAWTAAQKAEIESLVQSGIRRVYYPPALNAEIAGYEWSWLRPTKTLAIVSGDGDYDLPDDYGRLIGDLHYAPDEHRASVVVVSIGALLAMRARSDMSGAPAYAAIRYKASTGTTGQRQEALFYPEPDANYTLYYNYEAYSGVLSDTNPYPLGGMQYAELYIESCLAVAESRMNDEVGQHTQQYQALLVDAIARDRKHGAHRYGHMGHVEPEAAEFRRGWTGGTYPILYNGVPIP